MLSDQKMAYKYTTGISIEMGFREFFATLTQYRRIRYAHTFIRSNTAISDTTHCACFDPVGDT